MKKIRFLTRILVGVVMYLTSFSFVMAQQPPVRGTISDAEGNPLSDVSVFVVGTTQGTKSDQAGAYSIEAPMNGKLRFSLIGYRDVVVDVTQQVLNVTLSKDDRTLDEVVVVSYGTQQRSKITGAITEIDATKTRDVPVGQFTQKLQGRIPGAQITQTTGRPGQGMAVRIRGAASMNAGNTPLYVVDGQPITGDINNINPDEIESFSVLKDASATALYGSRAANGVVLITTKKGKGEGVSIDFSTYVGAQYLPQRGRPDVMNA